MEYYDITQSADYKERFVAPVESAYAEAHEIVSADPESLRLFNEATTTHLAAYKAANPEERTALMQRKRELLKEINKTFYEDTYSQVRLNEAFRKWEKSLDGHMNALNNWQQTKQDISRQVKEKELKNRTDFLNTWRNSYKEQAQAVENETQITDDIADFMKEKGIKFDTSRDDAIALAATQQSDEVASVDEMNRLINQGRSYKKLQALVKAQSEMLKEKTDYINKLKGASKPSSAPATTENKQRVSIPEGLAAKLARFGPRLATT